MKKLFGNFENKNKILLYGKALSSEDRIKIIELLDFGNFTINELAEKLSLAVSTTAMHVKVLEESGLILTRLEPGVRGTKKVCFKNVDEIYFDLLHKEKNISFKSHYIDMPIGNFSNCNISGTCGMVNELANIGSHDNTAVFYYPEKNTAQLIWFEQGFLEYRFPLDVLKIGTLEALELSFECCSEAPSYNLSWPSDITTSINDIELHTWTSPGDLGGRRGKLNPSWWSDAFTQYGMLKHFKITKNGTYCDESLVSSVTIYDLSLDKAPYLTIRIEVKEDALNCRGINLFGKKFGDYEQNILLRIDYTS